MSQYCFSSVDHIINNKYKYWITSIFLIYIYTNKNRTLSNKYNVFASILLIFQLICLTYILLNRHHLYEKIDKGRLLRNRWDYLNNSMITTSEIILHWLLYCQFKQSVRFSFINATINASTIYLIIFNHRISNSSIQLVFNIIINKIFYMIRIT